MRTLTQVLNGVKNAMMKLSVAGSSPLPPWGFHLQPEGCGSLGYDVTRLKPDRQEPKLTRFYSLMMNAVLLRRVGGR